jgi:tRNA-dihydrouridine synthase B
MITIHGRTRCQFYKGHADWSAIRAIKEAVKIPVIANGDITDTATAREALRLSAADGVMIGRGAQGLPWLPAQVAHDIFGSPAPQVPEGGRLGRMVLDHYDDMLTFYGRELGLRMARKHLGWYLEQAGLPHAREAILTSTDPAEVIQLLEQAFAELELAA